MDRMASEEGATGIIPFTAPLNMRKRLRSDAA